MFTETIAEGDDEGTLAAWYESQRQNWGFLPNFAGCFSWQPETVQAWANLNLTIRGGMERRRFELVTVAAARALRSTYCTVAHAKFLRDACDDEETVEQLALAPDGSTLSAQDAAVYAFATKLAEDAASIEKADVETLRRAGLSDADVADIVFAVAARSFFTKVLDGLRA
jgi:uncharacterized peroxidase-related enzyme